MHGWTGYSPVRWIFENISNILLFAGAQPNSHSFVLRELVELHVSLVKFLLWLLGVYSGRREVWW